MNVGKEPVVLEPIDEGTTGEDTTGHVPTDLEGLHDSPVVGTGPT